jgi:hypothetical protein
MPRSEPFDAGAQVFAHRRQGETAVDPLGEDADGRQGPQDPIQRRRVRLRLGGQVGEGLRAVGEQVGDAELGDDRDGHRDIPAEDELDQGRVGRGLQRGIVGGHRRVSCAWFDVG